MRRAHGLRGDVIVRPQTDDPQRFAVGASFATDEDPPRTLTLAERRSHADGVLLRFDEITDRNGADAMRGVTLTIAPDQRRQLDDDEYWPEELEGLAAVAADGSRLGVVSAVITGAAQDRLAIETPAGSVVEVPFVAAIATEVDLANGKVVLDPPPGLFD